MRTLRLYAMNSKGLRVLKDLTRTFGADFIESVISDNDKGLLQDSYAETAAFCKSQKIPFFPRKQFSGSDKPATASLAIGWRWMLPTHPNLFIIHDSLLPEYRGFSPLVCALINGEKRIGATLLRASPNYDEGPVLFQAAVPLRYPARMAEALSKMETVYSDLAARLATCIQRGRIPPGKRQNESRATYSLWRDERDYRLDFTHPAARLRRKVDALSFPYPGAVCRIGREEFRVLAAEEMKDLAIENRDCGKVIFYRDRRPVVVCGEGLLKINELVDAAGNAVPFPLKNFRTRFE